MINEKSSIKQIHEYGCSFFINEKRKEKVNKMYVVVENGFYESSSPYVMIYESECKFISITQCYSN